MKPKNSLGTNTLSKGLCDWSVEGLRQHSGVVQYDIIVPKVLPPMNNSRSASLFPQIIRFFFLSLLLHPRAPPLPSFLYSFLLIFSLPHFHIFGEKSTTADWWWWWMTYPTSHTNSIFSHLKQIYLLTSKLQRSAFSYRRWNLGHFEISMGPARPPRPYRRT